jgi:hypothetical protein
MASSPDAMAFCHCKGKKSVMRCSSAKVAVLYGRMGAGYGCVRCGHGCATITQQSMRNRSPTTHFLLIVRLSTIKICGTCGWGGLVGLGADHEAGRSLGDAATCHRHWHHKGVDSKVEGHRDGLMKRLIGWNWMASGRTERMDASVRAREPVVLCVDLETVRWRGRSPLSMSMLKALEKLWAFYLKVLAL